MKSLKPLSLFGLAGLVLATTLSVSCQSTTPVTGTGTGQTTNQTTNQTASVSEGTAAVTGVLYSGIAEDGRFVPPASPITVQVLERDKVIASIKTDLMGRFYLKDIPASAKGKNYTIKADNFYNQPQTLFAGRVLNLSDIPAINTSNQQQVRVISATLLSPTQTPLNNVEVRDKSTPFRSTRTAADGSFTLEVIGPELEVIIPGANPITIAVTALEDDPIATLDTTNIRTVEGLIKDQTNSQVPLPNVRVRVQGSTVSSLTGADGKYVLNGAPSGPFVLEVEAPEGYANFSTQVPPATFGEGGRPNPITQNINLQPVGSIMINFTAENAPDFDRLPPVFNSSLGRLECGSVLNCFMFDFTADDIPRPEYDNGLAVLNELSAFITVEGTNITRTVLYPPAPFRILYGVRRDVTGQVTPVRIDDRARAGNVVMSVKLDGIPGGRQSVTVSMTGFQTQKSIPIYVPAADTISTELITLYRVQRVSSFGDVQGVINNLDPALKDEGQLRIVYIDLTEAQAYEPRIDELTNPDLLRQIRAKLNSNFATVDKTTGRYYLKNVPTGTRVMLAAAMVNSDGELSDCYIPNTSVLLNVRAGQVNLAPDLTLARRPARTGNCPQ